MQNNNQMSKNQIPNSEIPVVNPNGSNNTICDLRLTLTLIFQQLLPARGQPMIEQRSRSDAAADCTANSTEKWASVVLPSPPRTQTRRHYRNNRWR